MSRLREIGYKRNRAKIDKAFASYLAKEEGSEGVLFKAVTEFARGKMTSVLFDMDDLAEGAEDFAQDIVLIVWSKLPSFKGDCSIFYSWLNRICYTHGADAQSSSTKEVSKRVPLQIEGEDGFIDDNPALYRDEPVQYMRKLPDFIQGHDLLICNYIRQGLDYEQIGSTMGLTETAVKERVRYMRTKVRKLQRC